MFSMPVDVFHAFWFLSMCTLAPRADLNVLCQLHVDGRHGEHGLFSCNLQYLDRFSRCFRI